MDRRPVVAGRFYPADPATLAAEVGGYLKAAAAGGEPALLAMAPHAGYVFSGGVAGRTLGAAQLASKVLLLGPNHTGRGTALSLWSEGKWHYPGGALAVDAALARKCLEAAPALTEDTAAHEQEHSLEVMLPFIAALKPQATILPLAVAEHRLGVLVDTARGLAEAISGCGERVTLLVSSDMSHFLSASRAEALDRMALEAVLRLDPEGLFHVVRENKITMCGVLPMTLGLMTARLLGAASAELVQYTNSGEASGDYDQVVGYAGVLVH